jgi:hypothetical protein
VLVVPHDFIVRAKKMGMMIDTDAAKFKRERDEKGKWAIFHGSLRLRKLFDEYGLALIELNKIIGDKRKCWENKRIFQINQLP